MSFFNYVPWTPFSYTGFENNPGAWTLLGTANGVVSNGFDVATPIPISVFLTIPTGQTYSFYLTTDGIDGSGVGYTNGTAEHAVYVSDDRLSYSYWFGRSLRPHSDRLGDDSSYRAFRNRVNSLPEKMPLSNLKNSFKRTSKLSLKTLSPILTPHSPAATGEPPPQRDLISAFTS